MLVLGPHDQEKECRRCVFDDARDLRYLLSVATTSSRKHALIPADTAWQGRGKVVIYYDACFDRNSQINSFLEVMMPRCFEIYEHHRERVCV